MVPADGDSQGGLKYHWDEDVLSFATMQDIYRSIRMGAFAKLPHAKQEVIVECVIRNAMYESDPRGGFVAWRGWRKRRAYARRLVVELDRLLNGGIPWKCYGSLRTVSAGMNRKGEVINGEQVPDTRKSTTVRHRTATRRYV